MGLCQTASIYQMQTITVASLNYSGILTSPYQYYQKEDETEKHVSEVFTHYVSQKYPQFGEGKGDKFSWDMGSIDTKWKNRYSPVNIVEVGIKADNTMMNQKQFQQKWQQVHQKTREQIKKSYFTAKYKLQQVQQRMKIQIERCREFDLFCYKTFMKLYYNIDDINQNIGKINADKYKQIRTQLFAKPFLSQINKLKKTLNCIKSIKHDVLFFQQANKQLVSELKQFVSSQFHIIHKPNCDSIILIRKQLVGEYVNFSQSNQNFLKKYALALKNHGKPQLTPKQLGQRFDFNNDSIFQAFGNYLLLNIHLSSKKQKNPQQLKQFIQIFSQLFELMPEVHLICGGDFNTNVDVLKFNQFCKQENKVNIAPEGGEKSKSTVKKKRTMIQPQRNKAEKLDVATKDYLLSTIKIKKSEVLQINGSFIEKHKDLPLTPNVNHPYDHFMILAELQKPKELQGEQNQ